MCNINLRLDDNICTRDKDRLRPLQEGEELPFELLLLGEETVEAIENI